MFTERMNTNNTLDAILASGKQSEDPGSRFYQLMRVDNAEHFLELRFRDGIKTAFAYDKLNWVNFAPAQSMLDMDFMGTMVSLEGRGLTDLFQALKSKKISWIKEADTDLEDNDTNTVFVKQIVITPPAEDFKDESRK